jgi:hypothetical protein
VFIVVFIFIIFMFVMLGIYLQIFSYVPTSDVTIIKNNFSHE